MCYCITYHTELFSEHTQLCFLTGINECLDDSFISCDQICINTMASFICGCHTGFQLNGDLITCSGMSVHTNIHVCMSKR